jgi:hypothetical protein
VLKFAVFAETLRVDNDSVVSEVTEVFRAFSVEAVAKDSDALLANIVCVRRDPVLKVDA